jgi:hypothetical protein
MYPHPALREVGYLIAAGMVSRPDVHTLLSSAVLLAGRDNKVLSL